MSFFMIENYFFMSEKLNSLFRSLQANQGARNNCGSSNQQPASSDDYLVCKYPNIFTYVNSYRDSVEIDSIECDTFTGSIEHFSSCVEDDNKLLGVIPQEEEEGGDIKITCNYLSNEDYCKDIFEIELKKFKSSKNEDLLKLINIIQNIS